MHASVYTSRYQKQVVVLTTLWLLQLHHVGYVGDNTIMYNVEVAIAYS